MVTSDEGTGSQVVTPEEEDSLHVQLYDISHMRRTDRVKAHA